MITIFAYLLAITAAELVVAFVNPLAGAVIHAALIAVLLGHYLGSETAPYRRVLPVLLLAPLLRILSLAMPAPFRLLPQIYWYAVVGLPLLLAAFLVVRLLGLPRAGVGLRGLTLPQGLIALTGVPLGIAAFSILRPSPVVNGSDWGMVIIGVLILTIFTGFTEEFIFRGLLQRVTGDAFGGVAAVLCSTLLFTAMYVGSLSWMYLLFIALVGLYFGLCVQRTGSIWGVALAHTFMNVWLLVVWPVVARRLG